MTALLLDSHVLHWWSAEPERLSPTARRAVADADELAVASISWFELAWLARHERILLAVPPRAWLSGLASRVRTISTSPAIAATAVELPESFPGDPADRIIYATASRARLDAGHQGRPVTSSPAPKNADHLVDAENSAESKGRPSCESRAQRLGSAADTRTEHGMAPIATGLCARGRSTAGERPQGPLGRSTLYTMHGTDDEAVPDAGREAADVALVRMMQIGPPRTARSTAPIRRNLAAGADPPWRAR